MRPFYITTPIYYVNDVPHLGHAYTTIACDALARFHRMRGDDTYFLTGTDEHGQKVEAAATKRGLTARQLVDEVAPRFAEAWKALEISNDDFIRTTEDRHQQVVLDLWNRMHAAGDLYPSSYSGWYCVGCEEYYTESQLEKVGDAWHCTVHKTPVQWVAKERSWFFKMSKYGDALLAHIEKHPDFIQPDGYRNEVVAFVKSGLRDLSVSRTSFSWGIPVPTVDDEGAAHIMYVWVDALTNYMSALGAIGSERHERYWRSVVHLIGKDILRFHAVYWPCFLLSAGLPLPRQIFAHGWWTVRGEKISKSIPATKIDPIKLSAELGVQGVDALRYYLLREVPLGLDGDFAFESLFGRYNAELANDLGNLVNRVLTLVPRMAQGDGVALRADAKLAEREADARLVFVAGNAITDAAKYFEAMAPSRALEAIWRLVREANKYVDATQPWKLVGAAPAAELGHVAYYLLVSLQTIARCIYPVMPDTATKLRAALADRDSGGTPAWPDPRFGHGFHVHDPNKLDALFPRLDAKRQADIIAVIAPDAIVESGAPDKAAATPPAPDGGGFGFDDFMRAELRVGQVLAAQPVPRAKKLLQLTVDLGEGRHRTIVAGIAEVYTPEAMIGRKLIIVANLAPRPIRGIVSEGMILAAGDDVILGLSALDKDVPVGTRVR